MASAYERMQQSYDEQQRADAIRQRQEAALSAIPEISTGPVQFSAIDTWLSQNPEAKYFRIGNQGKNTMNARTYTNGKYGQWSDNDAAIVSTPTDANSRDIFRYINVAAADPRTGKRGETATFGEQYSGGSFFQENGMDYNSRYGIVMSREEYGALKENLKKKGAQGFLQYERPQKNVEPPDTVKAPQAGAKPNTGKGVESIVEGGDQLGGAQTETPGTTINTNDSESLNKRALLG